MRQRIPGREKMPGRGFEAGLVPKENKGRGLEQVLGTEKPLYQNFQELRMMASQPQTLTSSPGSRPEMS